MLTSKSCNVNEAPISRCHTPLITICDDTSQIKLNLGTCGGCAAPVAALLLQQAGCVEWETICDPPKPDCCGAIDGRPRYWGSKRAVEKQKSYLIYPLHEIDPQGLSVFILDSKLKELGYGRYNATILLHAESQHDQEPRYKETNIIFDVDYVEYNSTLVGIQLNTFQPNLETC